MHSTRFDRFAHALINSASTGAFLQGLLSLKKERQSRSSELTPLRPPARARQDQEAA